MRNAKKQIKKQMLRQLALDPGNELPDEVAEPTKAPLVSRYGGILI